MNSIDLRFHTGYLKTPLKKIEWGDVPNEEPVKEKDYAAKWIEYNICHQVIRVRAKFGCTEWLNYCSSAKHCEKVKINDLNSTRTKLTSYSTSTPLVQLKPSTFKFNSIKRSKTVLPCPGFSYG